MSSARLSSAEAVLPFAELRFAKGGAMKAKTTPRSSSSLIVKSHLKAGLFAQMKISTTRLRPPAHFSGNHPF
jgi:hypothetical protein